tara:strand:+ start:204109 stop:204477 length:369 start_codon:yes stop_codon:yes gene_type:complete
MIFRNLKKEKELYVRELDIYKKEELLKIDKEVENYRQKRSTDMTNLAKLCHEQLGEFEHDFHNTKEEKGVELALLNAEVKNHEKFITLNASLLDNKDKEIKRLNDLLTLTLKNQPQTVIQTK